MLAVVVPVAVFGAVMAILYFAFRPRPPVRFPADPSGARTVASVDMAEDASLANALRDALVTRGATVSDAMDHDYAIETKVTLDRTSFRISVGLVGDDDAPWKVFVDDLPDDEDRTRAVLTAVDETLASIAGRRAVRWASRESDARGAAEWKPSPTD